MFCQWIKFAQRLSGSNVLTYGYNPIVIHCLEQLRIGAAVCNVTMSFVAVTAAVLCARARGYNATQIPSNTANIAEQGGIMKQTLRNLRLAQTTTQQFVTGAAACLNSAAIPLLSK
jgi:hypothetical protein